MSSSQTRKSIHPVEARLKKMATYRSRVAISEEVHPTETNQEFKSNLARLDSNLLGFSHNEVIESEIGKSDHIAMERFNSSAVLEEPLVEEPITIDLGIISHSSSNSKHEERIEAQMRVFGCSDAPENSSTPQTPINRRVTLNKTDMINIPNFETATRRTEREYVSWYKPPTSVLKMKSNNKCVSLLKAKNAYENSIEDEFNNLKNNLTLKMLEICKSKVPNPNQLHVNDKPKYLKSCTENSDEASSERSISVEEVFGNCISEDSSDVSELG